MIRLTNLMTLGLLVCSCKSASSPEVPATVLSSVLEFSPLTGLHDRERAPGDFEIIAAYEYPSRFADQRAEHVIGVDIDISSRASIDLGAIELVDVARQARFSAFHVYRLDEAGTRVGMHDPAFVSGSRFFVAFAVRELPSQVQLQYWGMSLGEEPIDVESTGREHPEARVRVVAASRREPQGWFQAHWLLLEQENTARSARIDVPFDCDGRVGRVIELDGNQRRAEFNPRPPIVPSRRVLVDQRCWVSAGESPPVVAAGAPEVPAELLMLVDELPDGAVVLENHWGVIRSLSFSRTGDRLAVAANGQATVWDIERAERLMTTDGEPTIRQVLLSPNGRRLALSAVDHAPTLWDVDNETRVRELLMSGTPSTDSQMRMSPSGQLFGVDSAVGTERALTVWGTRSGAPALRIGPANFTSWRFSADGFSILTCANSLEAQSWDLSDGAVTEGVHSCPLMEPPSRIVPAGAAPTFLLSEPMASELAAVPEDGSRIAFPIGPGEAGADRVVVLLNHEPPYESPE